MCSSLLAAEESRRTAQVCFREEHHGRPIRAVRGAFLARFARRFSRVSESDVGPPESLRIAKCS